MTDRERELPEPSQPADVPEEPRSRRPYAPPAVIWEESMPIESYLQSACAKLGPMSAACAAASSS
jgi:hypothetical protein